MKSAHARTIARRRAGSESGFTLIEALVATAIMVTVTGAMFTVMNPHSGIFQMQPEVTDIHQRVRVGVDTLTKDLMMAGAGAYSGPLSGSLGGFFAPIQPSRQGNLVDYDDGPGVFFPDRMTLFYVPSTFSQTSIAQAMPTTSAELKVDDEPGCPRGQNLCGFLEGMQVIIYDDTGAYDTMTITNVQDQAAHLQHNQQGDLSKAYAAGAKVAQINEHVYYYEPTTKQLMHYDGFQTAQAVIDNVLGVNFDYYGEPSPPQLVHPLVNQDMTYGPKPPVLGQARGAWPAGENCTVAVNAGQQVPRLDTLGPPGSGLIKLTPAQLTDGPWCPDANNNNRYDADLLRIRKIRVSLWLQTATSTLRAPLASGPTADALFTGARVGVTSRTIPDQIIRFDVMPRNLNLAR